jgi:hypothetical protein
MEKETGRVEAFSDGVFAIAITLLVLEFRVPELDEPTLSSRALGTALLHLWPSAVALVLSFFTILVMWINHHEFMRWVRTVDYPFLFANGHAADHHVCPIPDGSAGAIPGNRIRPSSGGVLLRYLSLHQLFLQPALPRRRPPAPAGP